MTGAGEQQENSVCCFVGELADVLDAKISHTSSACVLLLSFAALRGQELFADELLRLKVEQEVGAPPADAARAFRVQAAAMEHELVKDLH